MADKILKINYTIPVGTYLRLGYRPIGGASTPYTYVSPAPFFNATPYSLTVNDAFQYQFELSTICGDGCDLADSQKIYLTEGV